MKICFECSEYPPGPHGGIGSLIQILARGLVRAGHEVRVIGIYPASYPAPDEEVDEGVRVRRLRLSGSRWGWIGARRRLFATVKEWVRVGDVDLIEVPDFGAPAVGWPRLTVPVVTRLSGSESYFRSEMGRVPRWTTYRLERASLRRADFICSESQYIAQKTRALFQLDAEAGRVIYNPVDVPAAVREDLRAPRTVMFAGTLTKKKGIISLIRAWPAVLAMATDARLEIWGKDGQTDGGGSMQEYLAGIIPPEVKASVVFMGHVPLADLLAGFQRAGIVVLPSYSEGFALTPLHAMAAGCPVVYTMRGSGPELIEDGVTGVLVDPEKPGEIAAAVLRLFAAPVTAREIGARAREAVRTRFSWNTLLVENENFYTECAGRFRGRAHL